MNQANNNRAVSRTSSKTSVKWKDPVLSPTFHKVEIEQVRIVQRNAESVKFNDVPSEKPHSEGDRSSAGLQMFAPPPSEEGSMGTNTSEDHQVFRENYLSSAHESRKILRPLIISREGQKQEEFSENPVKRPDPGRVSTAPFVTLPLEPVTTLFSRERSVHTSQQQRPSAAELQKRQKMAVIRHMQRLQASESPQQRRLMSGKKKKKEHQHPYYYEVTPGVILTELPPNEYSQTAPESGFGYYEEDVNKLYVDRAKTVPHVTKSIIWTAKNRIASSRIASSNSSFKGRANELLEMDSNRKANMFIKYPFKQTPFITMNEEREEFVDDVVSPGYELRLTTAFTLSRVRRAIKHLDLPCTDNTNKPGRLLKAKLKTLCPVKVPGPAINKCQGIQPENHVVKKSPSYTPSPSRQRQLKDQLNKVYKDHHLKQAEYERQIIRAQSAASGESVHRTSPEPHLVSDFPDERIVLNKQTGLNADHIIGDNAMAVANQFDSLYHESNVIF